MPVVTRSMLHPGRPHELRIQTALAPTARHIRLSLQPGGSLFDAIVDPLVMLGIRCASMTILGGEFEILKYCVAPPDPKHEAVIRYSDAILAGQSSFIFGNATLGLTQDYKPIIHCHAAFRDANGRIKGGHILASQSILGNHPIPVLVTTLDAFDLQIQHDLETNVMMLKPTLTKAVHFE